MKHCRIRKDAYLHIGEILRKILADLLFAGFLNTTSDVRRLAEIDNAAAVGLHLPHQFQNVGMLSHVLLEKPLGVDPVEDEEHRGSHQYA